MPARSRNSSATVGRTYATVDATCDVCTDRRITVRQQVFNCATCGGTCCKSCATTWFDARKSSGYDDYVCPLGCQAPVTSTQLAGLIGVKRAFDDELKQLLGEVRRGCSTRSER